MVKSDRKNEIIDTAARLFHERGYSAVSMRDIAKAMEMKAASLYNHIHSKQEILVSLLIDIAEEFTKGMDSVIKMNISSLEKIKILIGIHIDITLRDPHAIACLNNDWMHLDKKHLKYFLKMREEYEDNFRKILQKGIRKKEIRQLPLDVILFSLLSTLRTLSIWYGKRKKVRPEELKNGLTSVLIDGISKKG